MKKRAKIRRDDDYHCYFILLEPYTIQDEYSICQENAKEVLGLKRHLRNMEVVTGTLTVNFKQDKKLL